MAVVALVALSRSAEGQEAGRQKPIDLAAYHHSGKNMRDVGLPFTIFGLGLAAVGIVEIATAGDTSSSFHFGPPTPTDLQHQAASDQQTRGMYFLLGSAACFGIGIPLLAVGQHRMTRAERMGYVPYVAPTQGGVVMGLRVVAF